MSDSILQLVPLGPAVPTFDRSCFLLNHVENYPVGRSHRPRVARGRDIVKTSRASMVGAMYPASVPFPALLTEFFETVTFGAGVSSTTAIRSAPPRGSGAVTCSG